MSKREQVQALLPKGHEVVSHCKGTVWTIRKTGYYSTVYRQEFPTVDGKLVKGNKIYAVYSAPILSTHSAGAIGFVLCDEVDKFYGLVSGVDEARRMIQRAKRKDGTRDRSFDATTDAERFKRLAAL